MNPAPANEAEPTLVALERALAEKSGLIVVRVADEETTLALAAHLERRAEARRRSLIAPPDLLAEGAIRDLGLSLGFQSLPLDPSLAARRMAKAAADRALILPLLRGSRWKTELLHHLARELDGSEALGLALTRRDLALPEGPFRMLELEEQLSADERSLFWEGIAFERSARSSLVDLGSLEAWWEAARSAKPLSALDFPASDGAKRLLDRLSLGESSWPLDRALRLGQKAEIDELQAHDFVCLDDRHLALTPKGRALSDTKRLAKADFLAVAEALVERTDNPWKLALAAELFARAEDGERADFAMDLASTAASDEPSLRADIAQGWRATIEALPPERRLASRMRAAELALKRGDAESALSFARASADDAPESYEALALLGRAALAKGDLVTAEVAFGRASALAKSDAERARVTLDLAEARYAAGDLRAARAHAHVALGGASACATTRLGARNVLGKLLLAQGRWAQAEAHFAEDEIDASAAKDESAGLRARLNRAIAVLSSGRNDEARWMLEGILAAGEAQKERRAIAFALSNLAVLAILRHDYAEALRCSERSIEERRRLGDKIGLARAIINLAELRLRLGLVAEAEQALAFARRAMSPGMPASRVTEAALVSASIHLAQGRTLEATHELARALSHISAATDGEKVSECHRLGARIALEEGDVGRAEVEIARAREKTSSKRGHAEVALLAAKAARAAGKEAEELATEALALAREADDENLLRETHWLLSRIHRADGAKARARSHLELAIGLRDRVADRLPPELQESYLSRRDLAPLALAEESELSREEAAELDDAEPSARPSELSSRPERRLVGEDPSMIALMRAIGKVARSDSTVLILGESGTGKELVAEAIHAASARAEGPLVKVNCAALVETLLLSELFGHERGAFTGALGRRRGRFEVAESGTLFLDEIGDISPRTQVALLRVLEQRTFERVGGTVTLHADVRIVAATNRDLRTLVEQGEFREDLYYRLRGITLEVPALRERMGDLARIAENLLERIARERGDTPKKLSREALGLLRQHRWPGNVRELDNALRAASLFAEGELIHASDLAENVNCLREVVGSFDEEAAPSGESSEALALASAYGQIRGGNFSLGDFKRRVEQDCIARALLETGGNITQAAALLGMKRPRLSQLVKQYNLGNDSEGD